MKSTYSCDFIGINSAFPHLSCGWRLSSPKLPSFLWVKVRDAAESEWPWVNDEHPSLIHAPAEEEEHEEEEEEERGARQAKVGSRGSWILSRPDSRRAGVRKLRTPFPTLPKKSAETPQWFFPPRFECLEGREPPRCRSPLRDKEDGGSRWGRQLLASR